MWTGRYWPENYWTQNYWVSTGTNVGLLLEIDGVDRTSLLVHNSLSYDDQLENRSMLDFRLRDKGPPPYFRPSVGNVVKLFNDGSIIFGGTIENFTDDELLKDAITFYSVSCVSFDQILDRYTVAKIFEGFTAGEIVKDIIDKIVNAKGETINVAGVQTGLDIERAVFGYRKASDVLRELAKLTGFSWFIDPEFQLNFFDRATFAAPFGLSDGSKNYRRLVIERSRDQYRNVQYVRAGNDTTDPLTEEFRGDSDVQTFTVAFEVADTPTVKLNAAAQTVGIRGEDDETAFQWFFAKGDKQITQRKTDAPISSTDVLQITYQGLFPIIVIVEDEAEILSRIAIEGGGGVYENIQDDDSIEKRDFAAQKASGLLRKWGVIPTKIIFETDDDGLKAGMLLPVNLPTRGADMVGDFLIDQVTATDLIKEPLGDVTIRYQVVALSGEHLGSWYEFFRKLQDAGRNLSLREGEKLLLIRNFTEGVDFAETFSTTDPLAAGSDDPHTCFQWGSVTERRAFWGRHRPADPAFETTGSQFCSPPVDA